MVPTKIQRVLSLMVRPFQDDKLETKRRSQGHKTIRDRILSKLPNILRGFLDAIAAQK